MPPRLLLPLALLGALALAWFLLSSGDDAPPPSELTTDEFDEHGEHAPTMTAKGRPAGTSRRTPRSAPARPSALAIGEPRPERVQVTLRGRVQGRDGRPVAGARVQVFGRDGQPIELVTASDGTFQFRGVPGRYRVLVDGGRDGVAWSSELVLDGNPAARPATLALQEVGTLSVTVSTPAGPAAGTVVQLTAPDADGLPPREARTDAMGRVRFEQLVASLYDVQVTDEDGTRHTKSLPLKAGANESLELLLVATRPVEGIVRQGGPEGPGVAQAELHVVVRTAQDEHRVERTWSTDYAGAFRVDMPRGRIEALHIRAEGHAARWLRRYELPRAFLAAYASAAKEAARLELVLPPGGLLHGIVRAPDGKPVADLELLLRWSVMPLGDEDLDIARTRTATDGSYRFEHCPAAVVRLQVASSRFGTLGEPTIAMGAGQEVERNLVVRPATVLQGIVSGTHAPVVAGARVWINAGDGVLHTADGVALETFTDERGWWRISGVAPVPRYFVRASHGDLRSPALEVAPHLPAPPVISLRLAGAGSVRGRILETATDEPRAGVQVLLTRNDPRDGSAQVVHSDAEGRYEATGLVAGAWTLWCSVPGRVPVRLPVEVDLQEPTLVDVPLAEGEVFEGLVLDPEGAPIEGAQVHVTSRDPATSRFPTRPPEIAVTDASGRFRLGGYATGRYAVTAWIQRTTNRAQVVVDRGRRDLRLTLEKPQANR